MAKVVVTVEWESYEIPIWRDLQYIIDIPDGATVGEISAKVEDAIKSTTPDNPSPGFTYGSSGARVLMSWTVRAIFY